MTSVLKQVRVLIPDNAKIPVPTIENNSNPSEDTTIFTDEEIIVYIELANNNPFRAAALALGALSTDRVVALLDIKADELETRGSRVSDAIMKRVNELNKRAKEFDEENSIGFSIVHSPIRPIDTTIH